MDRKTLIAVVMSSLLTAMAVVTVQATAAKDKAVTSPGGKVVCSGWIDDSDVPAFVETQLADGRSNIQVAGASALLVCAW